MLFLTGTALNFWRRRCPAVLPGKSRFRQVGQLIAIGGGRGLRIRVLIEMQIPCRFGARLRAVRLR